MDIAGTISLQSGFVLAVILLAVFFMERLGGTAQLAQRVFQVTLGVMLAFLVLSATTAFVRPPVVPAELQRAFFEDVLQADGADADEAEPFSFIQATSQRNAEVTTIHLGIGAILVAGSLAALRRWRTLPIGLALGGLLLVLFSGVQPVASRPDDPFSFLFAAYSTLFGATVGDVGQARDIAHFAVLFVGTLALVGFGYWQWERSTQAAATAPPSTSM
jgi:hypothetical protein